MAPDLGFARTGAVRLHFSLSSVKCKKKCFVCVFGDAMYRIFKTISRKYRSWGRLFWCTVSTVSNEGWVIHPGGGRGLHDHRDTPQREEKGGRKHPTRLADPRGVGGFVWSEKIFPQAFFELSRVSRFCHWLVVFRFLISDQRHVVFRTCWSTGWSNSWSDFFLMSVPMSAWKNGCNIEG